MNYSGLIATSKFVGWVYLERPVLKITKNAILQVKYQSQCEVVEVKLFDNDDMNFNFSIQILL